MTSKKLVTRKCIVCSLQSDRSDFVRIVRSKEGNFFVDETMKADGRGAYVCKKPECIDSLVKGAIPRAFKQGIGKAVVEDLINQVKSVER